jgi:hypothetical protein
MPRRKKGGPKRRYTMSPKARAQRRVAARRHGLRASTPLRQVLAACNRRQCPMRDGEGNSAFPCTVRQQAEAQAIPVESCLVQLTTNPELRQRYVDAIRDGKVEGLAEISGTFLAAQSELAAQELGRLKSEGFTIETPILDPETGQPFLDSQGNPITITRKNPRGEHTLKVLEMVGATAAQQAITPKAKAEKGRDEGIKSALEQAADMRARFGVNAP